jgi:DNA-dependent RNA polymerase auxiliary subunit epsilon
MAKAKKNESMWAITTERFVGYIDIMGFKDLVMRSTHEEVYEMMKTINEKREANAGIEWNDIKENLIRTTTYSDSIIIYSKDGTEDSFNSISNTISGLTNDLFTEGIPHKGAVAFGKMTLDTDNSIFFGQPLIDAYLLQEELSFYGVVIHGSVEKKISSFDIDSLFIKKFVCPLKQGASSHLTIFPIFLQEDDESPLKEDREAIYAALDKFRFNTSGHLRKYVDNTESYFNFINSK